LEVKRERDERILGERMIALLGVFFLYKIKTLLYGGTQEEYSRDGFRGILQIIQVIFLFYETLKPNKFKS